MSKFASVPTPLEIDDVQSARVAAGETRLTLSGRWLSSDKPSLAQEPLLVVQVEGRRHRFTPEAGTDTGSPTGEWRASFVLPAWAEPRRAGQAAVWVGDAVIALPAIHAGRGGSAAGTPPALAGAVPVDAPGREMTEAPSFDRGVPDRAPSPVTHDVPPFAEPAGDAPRSGPLADLLLKETVAALHAELEQRGTEVAQLRSALAGAHSELEARGATRSELESTLGQLGSELRRLMEAVDDQRRELDQRHTEAERERAEFEQRLNELAASRDQLAAELAATRDQQAAELATMRDRHVAEVAAARDEHAEEVGALRERLADAETRLERRNAETVAVREELVAVTVSREAARSEVAGLRSELERLGAELAVTREQAISEAGDLGEANRLLADAKALAEELRPRPETG
ncbi:MAG: hypothetical protein WCB67_19175 [Solirubrobacteraceae bacterium]